MKLHGSLTSPFVRHCRIALTEAQEIFDFVATDYAQSAEQSPAKRVPFLTVGDMQLHDSASILKFIREHSGRDFLADLDDFDRFCLINTLMDTAVNLFLLEKEGVTPANTPYLLRQQTRVTSTLAHLDSLAWAQQTPYRDSDLRLGCALAWLSFRQRADLSPYPNLTNFLAAINKYPTFADTAPPSS